MDRISRSEAILNMTQTEKSLAVIESLNELVELYQADIQRKLDEITTDETLQAQLKEELGIK
jgi:hypothetical protein